MNTAFKIYWDLGLLGDDDYTANHIPFDDDTSRQGCLIQDVRLLPKKIHFLALCAQHNAKKCIFTIKPRFLFKTLGSKEPGLEDKRGFQAFFFPSGAFNLTAPDGVACTC